MDTRIDARHEVVGEDEVSQAVHDGKVAQVAHVVVCEVDGVVAIARRTKALDRGDLEPAQIEFAFLEWVKIRRTLREQLRGELHRAVGAWRRSRRRKTHVLGSRGVQARTRRHAVPVVSHPPTWPRPRRLRLRMLFRARSSRAMWVLQTCRIRCTAAVCARALRSPRWSLVRTIDPPS